MITIQLDDLVQAFDINIQRQTGVTSVMTLEGPHKVGYLTNSSEVVMLQSMCSESDYKAIQGLLDARGVSHAEDDE